MHIHQARRLEGPITKDRPWWHAAEAAAAEGTLFRSALVEQIRNEIAAGTYETPEKLEAALERLLGSLQ
jgi:hypothetical protein